MPKKDIAFYASLAEVLAAVAVVISLIYAGMEFRSSRVLSARDADVQLFANVQRQTMAVIESASLAEIIVKAEQDPSSLTDAERLRYLNLQHVFFDTWEQAFFYHVDGIFGDAIWADWNEWFAQEAKRRPAFGWAENRRNFTSEDFAAHVDAVVSRE